MGLHTALRGWNFLDVKGNVTVAEAPLVLVENQQLAVPGQGKMSPEHYGGSESELEVGHVEYPE